MFSFNFITNNTTISIIGTALIWIALWGLIDFILKDRDLETQILGCTIILLMGLGMIYNDNTVLERFK